VVVLIRERAITAQIAGITKVVINQRPDPVALSSWAPWLINDTMNALIDQEAKSKQENNAHVK